MNKVRFGFLVSLWVVLQLVSSSYAAEQHAYMPGSVLAQDTQLQSLAFKVFEELEVVGTEYSDVACKLHNLIDWMAFKGGRPPKNFKQQCLQFKKELSLVPLEKEIQASMLQLIDKALRKRVGLSATAKWGIGLGSAAVVAVVTAYLARRVRGPDVLVETSEGQRISVRDPRVKHVCNKLSAKPALNGLFKISCVDHDAPDLVTFAELQRRFAEKQRESEYNQFVDELHKKINGARYGERDFYDTSRKEDAGMAIYDCLKKVVDWPDLQQRKKFVTDLKNCRAFQGQDNKKFLQDSLNHAFEPVILWNMSNEDMRKMVTFFAAELGFPTYSELYTGTKYLMKAIRWHNTHMVTLLIENRVPVNGSPSRDYQSAATPLAEAIYQAVLMNDDRYPTKETRDRAREIVVCLLKAGAKVNQIDSYYDATPLWMAFKAKDRYLIELLLKHGADLRLKEKRCHPATSVYEAALGSKDSEFKEWFLELCEQRHRYSPLRQAWIGTVTRAANSRAPIVSSDGSMQHGFVGSVQVAERTAEMQRKVAEASGEL